MLKRANISAIAALVGLLICCAPAHAETITTTPSGSGGGSSSTITAGTTATSGCGANGVLYSVSNFVQCDTGFTYGGSAAGSPVAISQGTVTTNIKGLSVTGTWNSAGTTFDAPMFVNITSTASASLSQLADWQTGGTSVAGIIKDGSVYGTLGFFKSATLSFNGPSTAQGMAFFSNGMDFYNNQGMPSFRMGTDAQKYFEIASTYGFAFSSSTSVASAPDTMLCRSAAGVTEFGTTACNSLGSVLAANYQPGIVYSAAGTPLPTCNAGSNGWSAVVSDSTGPTYRNAYTSGGAVTARVLCVNGTGWVND